MDWIWDQTVGRLLQGLADALADMFTAAMTWWLRPDLDPVALAGQTVDKLHGFTVAFGGFVLVLGLIGAGVRLAWRRDGSDLVEVVATIGRFVLTCAAGVTVIQALITAADRLTGAIMPTPGNVDIRSPEIEQVIKGITAAMGVLVVASPIVAVLIAVLFFGSTVAMFVAVLFRAGSIVVLMVVLPIAAAGGATLTTRQWFPKVLGWLLALIFWRPVAALIYRIAAELPQQTDVEDVGDAMQVMLLSLAMMLMAIVAMPAMMRLLSFATGSLGSGGGLAAAGAGAAVGGEMLRVRGEPAVAQANHVAGGAAAGGAGPDGSVTSNANRPPSPGGAGPGNQPPGSRPTGSQAAGGPAPAAPSPGDVAGRVGDSLPAATGEPVTTGVVNAAKAGLEGVKRAEGAIAGAASDATFEQ